MLFSIVFLVLRRYYGFDLYFCIDSTIMAIPYFFFGHYLKDVFYEVEKTSLWWLIGGTIITGLVVWFALIINGAAQMNGPGFGKNVLFNYLAGGSGSVMVFLLAALLSKFIGIKKVVRRISRNTLFIIFSHWLILVIIDRVHFMFQGLNSILEIIMAVLISIMVLLISDILIVLLDERIPILFGKLKYNKV